MRSMTRLALAAFIHTVVTAAPVAAETKLPTIAVIDFAADDPSRPQLGGEIADALTVMLSMESDITIVERAALSKMLDEQALSLSGVVSPTEATKIGSLVGARILVTGKAFPLGAQMFIAAKLISTETGLVEGVLVKSPIESDLGDMVTELYAGVADKLREVGPSLVAPADAAREDPLPGLYASLSGKELPVLSVSIPERHIGPASSAVDPALETELKKLLRKAGFSIVKPGRAAELRLTGEAFSEHGMRIGSLVSCAARAEAQLVVVKTGKELWTDSATTRAVDLSENIAGRSALQKAGRELAILVLRHFAEDAR